MANSLGDGGDSKDAIKSQAGLILDVADGEGVAGVRGEVVPGHGTDDQREKGRASTGVPSHNDHSSEQGYEAKMVAE
jgi:hypothetical protein